MLIALFYFQNFYGQSGSQVSSEVGLSLPIVSPLAPNANDLGKYGEIQVNESTGLISPSIPLFEYNAGNIIIPIALNYSGNGVRVNQDPTWAGVNWNCNPGGVITREVRDTPDEQTNDRLYFSESEMNLWTGSHTNSSTSVWHNKLMGLATGGLIDSEVDIFNYNFFGYSGSFYLDGTNNVHLLKYDKELKIIFYVSTTNESSFLITTPDGDSYWFGGTGASESSKFWVNNGAGSSSIVRYAQNAFYLTQISLLNGGVVNYEYDSYFNGGVQPIQIGYQETYEKSDIQGSPCVHFKRDLNFQLERFVSLKKISSSMNRQYIEFNGVNINTKLGITKLNNIVLKDENNQIQKKIVLDYLTINNENLSDRNKFFLTKVNFINSENQFMYKYQMEYNQPEGLPSKMSYAQDELGYFNGQINNTTLLPLTSYPILNLNCINFGNRKANLGFALKGSLTSITYPTGGRSEFEYELPVVENPATEFVTSHYRVFYREPDTGYDSSSPLTYNDLDPQLKFHYKETIRANVDAPLVITEPTTIRMRLNIRCMGIYTNHNNVTVQAIKNRIGLPSIIYQTETISLGYSTDTNNDTTTQSQYVFNLPPGSYDFILSLNLIGTSHNSQQRFIVNAEFDFPMENQNETYYPGLRIKKIQNYSNYSLPTTTRYFYPMIDNENTFQFFPNYVNVTRVLDRSTLIFHNSYRLNANSLKNNFRGGSPFCIYKNVNISYGGDNYENGGKSLVFRDPVNTGAMSYASIGNMTQVVPAISTTNLGMAVLPETDITSGDLNLYINGSTNETNLNSVLLEETILSGGSRPKPIKKTNYYYTEELQHVMHNIQPYLFCGLTKGYLFMLYDTKSSKCRLTSTKTVEYYGIRDSVSTLVNRTFTADKVSLPKSIETISSGIDAKKTNLFYPSDVANIPHLNGPDISTLNILQNNKHNVAQIVRTENYLNNVITDAKQITFYDFDNKILPKTISSFKTNQILENRVLFEDYSLYGKPTLVSLSNGTKTKYIYNDLDQLVLKIENFSSTSSINDGIILNTPCFYQEMYPDNFVTKYDYDAFTHNLIKITDPKCDFFSYSYDAFGRLQSVKDKDNNKLSENQYNYK
jgi:YD repeat-containing protein